MTTPKQAGRPPTDPAIRRKHSSYTLSPEALALLDQLAAHWGDSKSGAVERAIREAAEREAREATMNKHSYTTTDGQTWGIAPNTAQVGETVIIRNHLGEDVRCEIVGTAHPFNAHKVNDQIIEVRPLDGGYLYSRFQSIVQVRRLAAQEPGR